MNMALQTGRWRVLGRLVIMARLLPVLAMMAHDVMCHDGGVKHVMAGDEYGITNRQEKSISPRGFGNEISEVNFKECQEPRDSTSFHDFTTEDIEKLNNVSFSDPEYAGKVLLVVNLASF